MMRVNISINSPETLDHCAYGRVDQRLVISEGTADIELCGLTSTEATEVLSRLRGMPGIPDLGYSSPENPLTALLSAFPRKLDL